MRTVTSLTAVLLGFLLCVPIAAAEEEKPDSNDLEVLQMQQPKGPELSPAQQYCSSIMETATAAQIAQQTRNLEKAQKQLDDRIAVLAEKAEVLKSWIKLREDFAARATENLVQIYSKMKPDAAAAQIAAMDEMIAAAVVSKLTPKVSSLIMTEMAAEKAARLSAVIAGAGELAVEPERKPNAQ